MGDPGQDGTVLRVAAVWLSGPSVRCVPVFVHDAVPGLVHPGALSYHVIDAHPDLLIRAHAVTDVVSELVILVAGCGRTDDAAHGITVLRGSVIGLPQGVSQVALSMDLRAFQTD